MRSNSKKILSLVVMGCLFTAKVAHGGVFRDLRNKYFSGEPALEADTRGKIFSGRCFLSIVEPRAFPSLLVGSQNLTAGTRQVKAPMVFLMSQVEDFQVETCFDGLSKAHVRKAMDNELTQKNMKVLLGRTPDLDHIWFNLSAVERSEGVSLGNFELAKKDGVFYAKVRDDTGLFMMCYYFVELK